MEFTLFLQSSIPRKQKYNPPCREKRGMLMMMVVGNENIMSAGHNAQNHHFDTTHPSSSSLSSSHHHYRWVIIISLSCEARDSNAQKGDSSPLLPLPNKPFPIQ